MAGLPRSIIKKYGVTKKAWAVFRGKSRMLPTPHPKRSRITRGANMARRKYRSRGGGGFGGGLLSTKNIIGTAAGAYLAPKFGINSSLGAAAGSYMFGKKGVMGAAVGYFAAPYLVSLLGSVTGGNSTANTW